MAALELERLLEPVSDDTPSGESVEYDEQFLELEKLARGVAKEEDAQGNIVREAEDPNWPEVERIALELSERTKDLRVALYLLRARLALVGLQGLGEVLALIAGYLEQYWPSLHPALDPDDNNDPSARINTLASLCHGDGVLRNLRAAPLTQSRQFGRISYRDYAIAHGLMPAPPGQEGLPDSSRIDAAFADTELALLKASRDGAEAALSCIDRIDEALAEAVGGGQGIDFDPLRRLIREIDAVLEPQLARRESDAAGEEGAGEAGPGARPGAAGAPGGGQIRSRADVLAVLDRICRYYADNEPSSPVPLLLERTKRLVTMSFIDILKDLTPGGVQEFGVIAGIREEDQQE
jgi:type VI secretion system protein ImpA